MEVQQGVALGISILSSAASAGVRHVVFSSAPYATKLSAGKTPVPNLDGSSVQVCLSKLVY